MFFSSPWMLKNLYFQMTTIVHDCTEILQKCNTPSLFNKWNVVKWLHRNKSQTFTLMLRQSRLSGQLQRDSNLGPSDNQAKMLDHPTRVIHFWAPKKIMATRKGFDVGSDYKNQWRKKFKNINCLFRKFKFSWKDLVANF